MKRIRVEGIVQGVGFRPFIYNLAKSYNLKGYVKNCGTYVEIVVSGDNIESFIKDIERKKPELAKINKIVVEDFEGNEFSDFYILESDGFGGNSAIPPDIAICNLCLKEMFDKKDRRYRYPFISCINCGPRFTITEKLPFDRENTSMKDFPLCEECLKEYEDPRDRRFHAQTTCCPKCGPRVFLNDKEGDEAIKEAIKLLEKGKILAIKGIGGYHLFCRADRDEPVLRLREILNRPSQPFAVMSLIEEVKKFAILSKEEEILLTSRERPIVVLKKSKDYYLSEYVSNLDTVGVMLPYTGLHYLLFNKVPAYVATSANLPGLPMAIDEGEIVKLKVDGYLMHNRRIINRCDDSVVKYIAGRAIFLRRSRGYVPEPIEVEIKNDFTFLCVGAELNSTVCLVKGNKFYLSQHIGNTSKYETFLFLKEAIKRLMELTNTDKIDFIVSDLHPLYNSTKLAEELSEKFNVPLIKVQHHFAHGYSLLGDNNYFDECIILALDGLGYGLDGKIWGGEILKFDSGKFKRVGHLEEQYQPGGDLAVKYPFRMLLSILYKAIGDEVFEKFEVNKILEMQIKKRINSPITTSTGRVLDAISSLLDICQEKTYEGEPAIRLEGRAKEFNIEVEPKIKNNILLTTPLVEECYNMLINKEPIEKIAYYSLIYLADGLFEIAKKFSDTIGITGGVSYNKIIVERIKERCEEEKIKFLYHSRVPNGDGGISFGQGLGGYFWSL
ncbi:(NiFe) hydrogenase maturation protein HypF [Methanocaldococcus infernus ME]|uniref:Carbamoyltransferase n=1 Tax=Methanocaldococcus infernus (strain DSM 11812 / JCM 15783 / ME) TaxID=573063 RepID=D5VRH5_METIM|nr:carbamoyltransferase HypF [Methanocaldococcus infernus]ADG13178.1 (NiFe) hydrogenase maturation protein HypF [Methanocaldococcus infernus ME]